MSAAGTLAGARLRPANSRVLGLLAAGTAVLLAAFWPEAQAAVRVWDGSTAYSHCWFIAPIALWLAWERRALWAATPVVPAPWAAALAVPVALAWFAAERLGIMEGRQLTALALWELLALGVLGGRMAWAFSAPLLYLVFLVPFGAFFVPALQDVTTWFITTGLELVGIPFFSDGYTIDTVAGPFYVAEACAGLRFLIASIAFGVLYACLIYRSPGRRVLFMLASVAIPIAANGLRGLGIVVLGDILGSAQAAAADHLLYGWAFFSIVILLLILAGLPFREDQAPLRPPPGAGARPGPAGLGLATACVLAVGVAGPGAAALLARGAAPPSLPDLRLAAPAGCTAEAQAVAGGRAAQAFHCGGETLAVAVAGFSARASPALLFAARAEAAGESGTADVSAGPLPIPGSAAAWRLVETEEPTRLTATALWIDGRPATGGLADRRRLALASLGSLGRPPVLVSVGVAPRASPLPRGERERLVGLLAAFIAAQPALRGDLAP